MRALIWIAATVMSALVHGCSQGSDTIGPRGARGAPDNGQSEGIAGTSAPEPMTENDAPEPSDMTRSGQTRDRDQGDAGGGELTSPACAGVFLEADTELLPVDVVWAVDSSIGMVLTSGEPIQNMITEFSQRVVDAGIDARIILLAGATSGPGGSEQGFCMPEPLGSGQCGAASAVDGLAPDSRPPEFVHLDTPFGYGQGIGVMLDNYAAFEDTLRDNARTHLVTTENGPPPMAAQAVIDHVEGRASATDTSAWEPGLRPGTWTFSGATCVQGWAPTGGCPFVLDVPYTTLELIDMTGGVLADLTQVGLPDSDPFEDLLAKLTEVVVVGTEISCSVEIPRPSADDDLTLDYDQVNVFHLTGGSEPERVPRVQAGEECGDSVAWRYDDPDAPSTIDLCPAACEQVRSDTSAGLEIQLGCETIFLI